MSFGFSIGDIILLSQLSYNLYVSVSSGRKAASRDLKELEDVLFSLKCSIDHLGDVSQDVLSRAHTQSGGSGFKEKLDRMVSSCGATLQELDTVTKKYREAGIDAEEKGNDNKGRIKGRTLDDVTRSIKVNWKKVRWDQEKQSLQQYREKLKSHTDAINLLLTSTVWANAAHAETRSKTNHERTHSLLEEVLKNPQTDPAFQQMMREIHTVLTSSHQSANKGSFSPIKPNGMYASPQRTFGPQALRSRMMASPYMLGVDSPGFGPPTQAMDASQDIELKARGGDIACASASLSAFVSLPSTSPTYQDRSAGTSYPDVDDTASAYFGPGGRKELSPATIRLNNERRAFAVTEIEAFKERHARPTRLTKPMETAKPAFLINSTPNIQQLQMGLSYIFCPLPKEVSQVQARHSEIMRWKEGFASLIRSGGVNNDMQNQSLLDLMVAMNEAVENSGRRLRQLFYQSSGSAEMMEALEQLQNVSKSVRVIKEIEEFQDAKEMWDEI